MSKVIGAVRFKESSGLMHYGIAGQRWHVRRFQNEDGTLTEEGKRRYLKGMSDREKSDYGKLNDRDRSYVERQMDKGMSFGQARQKLVQRKNTIAGLAIAGTAVGLAAGGAWIGKYGKTTLKMMRNAYQREKARRGFELLMKKAASL